MAYSLNSMNLTMSIIQIYRRSPKIMLIRNHSSLTNRLRLIVNTSIIKQVSKNAKIRVHYFGNHFYMFRAKSLFSACQISKCFLRTSTALNKFDSENEDDDFDNLSELVDLEHHSAMLQQYHLEALNTQQLLVIQPVMKNRNLSQHKNRDDLMMAETVGLVDTLGWTVLDKTIIEVEPQRRSKYFFSGRQLRELRERIESLEAPKNSSEFKVTDNKNFVKDDKLEQSEASSSYVSAVFVSTFRLSSRQRLLIEQNLGKTVLDRYNVVLQIFKRHAKSKEAKLQSELAEMPYLKSRLLGDYEIELESKYDPSLRKGEKFFSTRRLVLSRREKHLRNEIDKVRLHRETLRKNRTKLEFPTVAIVGYTNAGKTSLIKALTGKEKLRPRDQLFATLDVTVHACKLPSKLNILLIDTVGFISDIPTDLIACFNATLEDAALADVLIHVRDVSNPDNSSQDAEVKRTLRQLNLPSRLLPSESPVHSNTGKVDGSDVITVANKIDLIDSKYWTQIKAEGMIPVSCHKGYGLDYLLCQIENAIFAATGRRKMTFKVSNVTGIEEYNWLRSNTSVYNVVTDPENEDYWLINTIVKQYDVDRFEKQFLC